MILSRGQSEVLGITLLIGVVVTTTLVAGTFALEGEGDSQGTEETLANVEIEANETELTLTHIGGDSINTSDVSVVVRDGDDASRFVVDSANLSGGDDVIDPGESVLREHGASGETLSVSVVATATNDVLAEETFALGDSDTEASTVTLFRLSWETEGDWDSAETDGSLVHTDAGDHAAAKIALAHAVTGERLVAYWPLDKDTADPDDAGPYDNEGTVDGDPTGETEGVFGTTSYEFDGSGDTINVSDSPSLEGIASEDAFTISTWVNTTDDSDTAPLWSQYDGLQGDSGGDFLLALREGVPAALVGNDGVSERDEGVETDWTGGTERGVSVADGQLRLNQTEGAVHGAFDAPKSTGTERVTTGFEPDLVVFRPVVTGRQFNETAELSARSYGTGRGFADCTVPTGCQELAQTFATGSFRIGAHTTASTDEHSVFQAATEGGGGGGEAYFINGTISATDDTGFTVTFDSVFPPSENKPHTQILYSAYAFPDRANIDVGSFRTLDASGPNANGTQQIRTGFSPDYVHAVTTPAIGELDSGVVNDQHDWGWSEGWSINKPRTLGTEEITVGETGRISAPADGGWKRVEFENSYDDPVVVGTATTENDAEEAMTFDVKQVRSDSAQMRLCETDGAADGCDTHPVETAGYIVVDASKAHKVEGLNAGTDQIKEGVGSYWKRIGYRQPYESKPVVLATTQTTNGAQPVDAWVTSRLTDRFTLRMCHLAGDDSCDTSHSPETVGWIALPEGTLPFEQVGEAGQTGKNVYNSDWESQSFTASFGNTPTVVASIQTKNDNVQAVTEARDVTTDGVEVRYCQIEATTDDGCDENRAESVGWVAVESGVNLTVTQPELPTQFVLAEGAHGGNDYSLYTASESHLIHTLWAADGADRPYEGGLTGRLKVNLTEYTSDGFRLGYDWNSPDSHGSVEDRFLVTYLAVGQTGRTPELGVKRTPQRTGTQTIETTQQLDDVVFTATNMIPELGSLNWTGDRADSGHIGWMHGGANLDGTAVSAGYGSHASVPTGHVTGSRTSPLYQLYSDEQGNLLGTDEAIVSDVSDGSLTLDWRRITTSSTSKVARDQVLYVYRSFGLETRYESAGEWESPSYDAGKPVYWNDTTVAATVPDGTGIDINYSTDGSTWYDEIGDLPRSDTIRYNVTLTGGDDTPVVDWLNTTVRGRALDKHWQTDTEKRFDGGRFVNTTTTGEGVITLDGTDVIGEAGRFDTADGNWQRIEFEHSYDDPVVVGTTNTKHEAEHALTFDARYVRSDSAEMRVCETEGSRDGCDSHATETVGYMVIDASVTNANDDDDIAAGQVSVGEAVSTGTERVRYDERFQSGNADPRVFANVQTARGAQPVEARVTNIDDDYFEVGICHQETNDDCDSTHVNETVGWVAVNPNYLPFTHHAEHGGGSIKSSRWVPSSFDTAFDRTPVVVAESPDSPSPQQTKIDEIRNVELGSVEARYCEIEGFVPDSCDGHTNSGVDFLAVTQGPLQIGTYRTSGEYRSEVFDAGRRVNWTDVTVEKTEPGPTSIDLNYSDGSDWYDSLDAVPDSRTLRFNASFSGTTDETPTLDTVTVEYNETGWEIAETDVADDNWHHVTATYDGTYLRLYVDGAREQTVRVGSDLDPTTVDRQLGAFAADDAYYEGRLDAPRVYNRSLSDGDVKRLYNATTNGTLIVQQKSYRTEIDPVDTDLELTNVGATIPNEGTDTNVTLWVDSDPDEDGVFEDASDPIVNPNSGDYSLPGLTNRSRFYRLRVRFNSSLRTTAPTLTRAELEADID